MGQVMTFVRERVVQAAITRLVTSLNPAGAFIQAIIAIYNTVMFFVERLRQIAQVVGAFIDSIAAIASGNIGSAANRVETTMAGLLTLVISFLARIAGLGRVSDAVVDIVNRIRAPIDRALDRVIEWIVSTARRLGRFIAQAGVPQDPATRLRLASQAAVAAARRLTGRVTEGLLNPMLVGIKTRYGLAVLQPFQQNRSWWVRATVNPTTTTNLGLPTEGAVTADGQRIEIAVDMNGAGHRLIIVTGTRHAVLLASAEAPLSAKIGAATGPLRRELRAEQALAAPNATKVDRLQRQIQDLVALQRQASTAETEASRTGTPLTPDHPTFRALAAAIQRFGRAYSRTDISEAIVPTPPTPAEVAADPDNVPRRAWCREVNLNQPDSETAKGLYAARNNTIQSLIGSGVLVASVGRRLPDEALHNTVDWALRIGRFQDVNVRKFVTDQRDKFRGR